MNTHKLTSIPTNIITGFLGAGKTSAILNLLKQKPANERWAVLVNEFGEIGVDGALFEAQIDDIATQGKSIYIQEVSGGCMCCSSGLTMQVALNQLLTEAKPHRLLIEPTGLGHPIEVLDILSNQYYKNVISLEKTITLVDARNLADQRYTGHVIFNQQLDIADIVVGSKTDLYNINHKQALTDYVANYYTGKIDCSPEVIFIEHGELPLHLLAGKTLFTKAVKTKPANAEPINMNHTSHQHSSKLKNIDDLPDSGFVKAENHGEGFESIGWRFAADKIFDREKLYHFINNLKVIRLKAVFISSEGVFTYNITADNINEVKVASCHESRLEIICTEVNDQWEAQLFNCLL